MLDKRSDLELLQLLCIDDPHYFLSQLNPNSYRQRWYALIENNRLNNRLRTAALINKGIFIATLPVDILWYLVSCGVLLNPFILIPVCLFTLGAVVLFASQVVSNAKLDRKNTEIEILKAQLCWQIKRDIYQLLNSRSQQALGKLRQPLWPTSQKFNTTKPTTQLFQKNINSLKPIEYPSIAYPSIMGGVISGVVISFFWGLSDILAALSFASASAAMMSPVGIALIASFAIGAGVYIAYQRYLYQTKVSNMVNEGLKLKAENYELLGKYHQTEMHRHNFMQLNQGKTTTVMSNKIDYRQLISPKLLAKKNAAEREIAQRTLLQLVSIEESEYFLNQLNPECYQVRYQKLLDNNLIADSQRTRAVMNKAVFMGSLPIDMIWLLISVGSIVSLPVLAPLCFLGIGAIALASWYTISHAQEQKKNTEQQIIKERVCLEIKKEIYQSLHAQSRQELDDIKNKKNITANDIANYAPRLAEKKLFKKAKKESYESVSVVAPMIMGGVVASVFFSAFLASADIAVAFGFAMLGGAMLTPVGLSVALGVTLLIGAYFAYQRFSYQKAVTDSKNKVQKIKYENYQLLNEFHQNKLLCQHMDSLGHSVKKSAQTTSESAAWYAPVFGMKHRMVSSQQMDFESGHQSYQPMIDSNAEFKMQSAVK